MFELSKVAVEAIRTRVLSNLVNIDPELAKRVADGLAMPLPAASAAAAKVQDLDFSDALSIVKQGDPSLTGRKVGILFDAGSDLKAINSLVGEIEGKGGRAFLIAPKVGGLELVGGTLKADGQLAGSPSVLFDAVAIVLSADAAAKLCKEGAAVQFVMDAFGHVKTIGFNADAQALLDKAWVEKDEGIVDLKTFASIAPRRHWQREPKVRTLA